MVGIQKTGIQYGIRPVVYAIQGSGIFDSRSIAIPHLIGAVFVVVEHAWIVGSTSSEYWVGRVFYP